MRILKPLFLAILLSVFSSANPGFAQQKDGATAPPTGNTSENIPIDPAIISGQLDNGMRFIIRPNNRPEGTALVRMRIGSGSLSETDNERGLAHFLEHMAFNGSAKIAEGEMVKLLEREGLAFGADTNASTNFDETIYKLDLPRNDLTLLDTALMLMRETASELTIAKGAVDRERGVILAEMRDRNNFAFKNLRDQLNFLYPAARFNDRFPIGIEQVLKDATADDIRALYRRIYVPANTTMIIVGDFAPDDVKAAIAKHFASWRAAPMPEEPQAGPADLARSAAGTKYIDPALDENILLFQHAPYDDKPDTAANRQDTLLKLIALGAINRRLAKVQQQDPSPFSAAAVHGSDFLKLSEISDLSISTEDGKWQAGLTAAAATLREALVFGFSDAEIAEQIANFKTYFENADSSSATRTHANILRDVMAYVTDSEIPTIPGFDLALFKSMSPQITANAVSDKARELFPSLDKMHIRFSGRLEPEGGVEAIRGAWNQAISANLQKPADQKTAEFAYTNFGPAGRVVKDKREGDFGIRRIVFANGVRLNLKKTDLSQNKVSYRIGLDGGELLNTKQRPIGTALMGVLSLGGLGKHSADELTSTLAGRSVGLGFNVNSDRFVASGTTTRDDLQLQLQLTTAFLVDPGYRKEGETAYQRAIAQYYKQLDVTPNAAFNNNSGAIISDNDPRFSLAKEADMLAQNFRTLQDALGDRLTKGAIEIALVGDFDEDAAIAMVAKTLGALPKRELQFRRYSASRLRGFTKNLSPRTITHRGEKDQALVRLIWPTSDDRDQRTYAALEVLQRVATIALEEEIREKLGQAYSPYALSDQSHTYTNYGVFMMHASVDHGQIEAAHEAMRKVANTITNSPINADMLERARRPLIEGLDNALKSNGGWLSLADRAASEPESLTRFKRAKAIYLALSPNELRKVATTYLASDKALEIAVVPNAETKDHPDKNGETQASAPVNH